MDGQCDLIVLGVIPEWLHLQLSADLLVSEFEPRGVLQNDVTSNLSALDFPGPVVLALPTKLVGHRRDAKRRQDPVVHVAADSLAEDRVRVALVLEIGRPGSTVDDLLENHVLARVAHHDVIELLAVVRPDPHVAVRVRVGDELDLVFMLTKEVTNGARLGFGEGLGPAVALTAWARTVI